MMSERYEDDDDTELPPQAASAVDRHSQRRIRDKAKRAEAEDADFWRRSLADPVGRRCLWNLLLRGRIFSERFASGPNGFPQESATWYAAGERDYALAVLRMMQKYDIANTMLMMKEHDPFLSDPPKTRRREVNDDV